MNVSEINKKAAVATKWSSITEIVAKLIAPITSMILARLLAPEAFGVVATVTMITSFADIFTDAGFQKYLVQHDFEDREDLDRNTDVAFWTNLTISVFIWLIIFVFREQLASLVGNPGLGNVVAVSALSLPLTSFSSIQMARYKRDFDFKTLFYIRLVSSSIPFLVTVPLAFLLHSFWALIIGTLASNLVNAVILTVRSQWRPHFFYSKKLLFGMFSYSWWILIETISVWLTNYIGIFIVGIYLSQYYVGLFKTSISTVNQIIGLISAATVMPLFSSLSRLKSNNAELQNTYCSFIKAISVFIMPLGVGIWLYRDLVTDILLGAQWREAADFVGLWGLTSSVTLILGTYCNSLYNAIGKTYLSFAAQILHLAALIPTLIWASPQGFECLYISRSLVRLQIVLVELIIMKFVVKFPLGKLFKGLAPAAVSTAVMALAALALEHVGSSLPLQIAGVAVCIVVYFSVMATAFRKSLLDALSIFGINIKLKNRAE